MLTVKELKEILTKYNDTDEIWLIGDCDDCGYSWQALMVEADEIMSVGKENF